MTALWVHDHRFFATPDGRVYTSGSVPASLWSRYLDVFSALHVVARRAEGEPDPQRHARSDAGGVRFSFVPSITTAQGWHRDRATVRETLREALASVDAAVIRLPSFTGTLAVAEARALGVPYAVELVGCPWDALWNYGTLAGRGVAPWMFAATRRLVREAPFVLYVTRHFLQRRYPTSGRFAGISDVAIPAPDPDVLAARLDRQGAARSVGMIGHLGNRYKGHEVLLRAAGRLGDGVEVRVLGGGDPAPWQRLADRLGVNTRFDGTLPAGEPVLGWLDDIDVYVQPSRQEGLPRALVEAMSRGCPALGSSAGGIAELLEPGCLHRPGRASALTRDLGRALRDASWRQWQATRNAAVAREYARPDLDARRRAFWAEFADFARLHPRLASR